MVTLHGSTITATNHPQGGAVLEVPLPPGCPRQKSTGELLELP